MRRGVWSGAGGDRVRGVRARAGAAAASPLAKAAAAAAARSPGARPVRRIGGVSGPRSPLISSSTSSSTGTGTGSSLAERHRLECSPCPAGRIA
eukprot:scaffold1072_cov356-Prasinococcus_capsulatus_cf.AAC.13